MFRSKADVDRHVHNVLRKVKNDQERNLRCCSIAQLYYKLQDYDSAKRFVTMYLSEKSDSAVGYKLLGQACEGLNQTNNALIAYKKSLQLEANQMDLVLRICDLLCDKDVEFDSAMAKYWVEKASQLFPHEPVVFKLKERLLTASSNGTSNDLEGLLLAELKARPNDVNIRIKLLRLQVDSGRIEPAYNRTLEIESQQIHTNCLAWYQCVNHICKVYSEKNNSKCDWIFYIHWIFSLNRICALTLSEVAQNTTEITECTESVFNLDQILNQAHKQIVKAPEIYTEFLKHVSSQLAFYFALLLMKKAKKENSIWKEIKKALGPFLLLATMEPPSCDAVWCLSLKDSHRKLVMYCSHEGMCRLVQAIHVLKAMSQESQSEKAFIDKVNHYTANDWRRQIYKSYIFPGDDQQITSFFVNSNMFVKIPLSFPSLDNLKNCLSSPSFEVYYPRSLHHLVWLGLQSVENRGQILSCRLSSSIPLNSFKSLQLTVKNLQNCGVESLNQLDVESFLYISIFSVSALLEETTGFFAFIKPAKLPADISSVLCTSEQSKWWNFACGVKSGSQKLAGKEMSELRHTLQKGIQVVRGEDLPLPLIILLARTFALRGEEAEKIEEAEAYDNRALYLWQKVTQQLEQYESKEGVRQKFNSGHKLFEYPKKQLSNGEVAKLLNESRYFIACYYIKNEQLEQAVELLKPIKTVEAVYRLAEIYHSMAEEQVTGFLPSEVTTEISIRQKMLLSKAKDYCIAANEMIKNVVNHPFQDRIDSKLNDIKELLSQIEGEKDALGNISFLSDSSFINDTMHSPIKFQNVSKNINASTPSRRSYDIKHRPNCADLVELFNLQQSNSQLKMQQVLEQIRLVLNRVESVTFELTTKFNNLETEVKSSLSDIKKEVKKSDLYNVLDEEDYNDEMLQCNYPTATSYYQTHQRPVPTNNQHFAYPNTNVPATPYLGQRHPEQMYQNNMGFLPYADQHQQQQGLSEFFMRAGSTFPPQILNQKLQQPIQNSVGGVHIPGVPFSATSLTQGLAGSSLTALPGGSHMPSLTSLNLGQTNLQINPTFPQTVNKFPVFNSSQPSDRGPTNVVITTSDTLPTGIPPVQPMLSVTIPPQHRLGDTSVHNYQITLPTSSAQTLNQLQAQSEVESDDETTAKHQYDPVPAAFPQGPLVTGEENEDVLFNASAVLTKYVDNSWKEREEGVIKILKWKAENKARILMKKDKVHKICANHIITADMTLTIYSTNSWVWSAQELADGQMEKFCVQFKTKVDSDQFKMAFDKVKNTLFNDKGDKSFSTTLVTSTPSFNSSFDTSFNFTAQFPPKTTTPVFTPPKLKLPESQVDKSKEKKDEAISTSTPEKHNVGGFIFSAPPTIKAQDKQEKNDTSTPAEEKKTTNVFSNFSFKPSLFNLPTSKGGESEVKDNSQQPSSSKNHSAVTLKSSPLSNVVPAISDIKPKETSFSSASLAENKPFFTFSKLNIDESKPPQTSFGFTTNQPITLGSKPFALDNKKTKPTVEMNTFVVKTLAEQQNTQSNVLKPSDDSVKTTGTALDNLFSKKLGEKNIEKISDKNAEQPLKNLPSESGSTKDFDFATLSENKSYLDFGSLAKNNQDKGFTFTTSSSGAGTKTWSGFEKTNLPFQTSGNKLFTLSNNNPAYTSTGNEVSENKLFIPSNNNPAYTSTGNEVSEDGDQGVFVPTADFKPVIDMPAEIEVVSGEENEKVLFEERAKLYRFDQKTHEWKERGIGNMKILRDKDTGVVRLLMRREQVFKVCCNHRLTNNIAFTSKGPNRYQWMATDFSEDITSGVNEVFTIKFKTENQALKFKAAIDKAQTELESVSTTTPSKTPAETEVVPLSALVKHKEGSWECPGCYMRVESDCAECSVCNTPNPNKPAVPKTSQPQANTEGPKFKFVIPPMTTTDPNDTVTNAPMFSFGFNASSITSGTEKSTTAQGGSNNFSFASGLGFNNSPSEPKKQQESKFVFNDSQNKGLTIPENKAHIFGNTFLSHTQEPVTFGSLIKANEENKLAINSSLNTPNKLGGGTNFGSSPMFQFSKFTFKISSPQKEDKPDSNDDTASIEDEGEQIHFQPVIEMPDKVEVVTGEENETVLFSERAKLFRFATKEGEWKERGVGDVKILKHRTTNRTRILMRREIVMKLCLNHYITPDIQMEPKGEKSWMWSARDFSEAQLTTETFTIKFKHEPSAVKFHDVFQECQASATSTDDNALTTSSAQSENDFFEVVYELKVPDDLRQKALALQLPPNFYAYLQRPKCPGCVGCESDDESKESDCVPGNQGFSFGDS